ncbi:MAG: DNA polymerase III subunit gamma/tau [Deltaproteobacteria bacterium]|nr:DNA polymerase III subunit gamma/tau [Deltaproteobacteria bacterium]
MSSYLVIARKWRPALFEEIVGQSHVTRTLKNAVSSGRIAHAYLFSGPRGVGKTTAARILAKSLNCVNGPTPTPCNACESCKGIASGSSVDVFEIDGASNTGVDNVRELRESVRYVPTQGKYKIYIIDEVHMLSTPAFNALLKTLEEPPPHAVFIFATTEVHKIPATILSRCQRFDFKRIPFKELQQHLKKIVTEEGIPFEEKAIFTVAREADGSLRDGQSLLEQVLAFAGGNLRETDVTEALGLMDRSVLYEISDAIIKNDGAACLNIIEKIYNFGYDLKRACGDLLEHIRDLTVVKVTGEATLLDLPDSELERLGAIAGGVGVERLHMLFSIISRGYEEVSRSSSPRYSFEMALLRAAHLDEIQPVGVLLERLEALKDMVGTAGVARTTPAPVSAKVYEARTPEAAYVVKEIRAEAQTDPEAQAAGGADGLLEYLRQKLRPLSDALGAAEVKVDGATVEVTVPADKQPVLKIKDKQIESVCSEYLKQPVRVRISAAAGGIPAADKKKETDPLVSDAIKMLGGRVIEDRRRTNV